MINRQRRPLLALLLALLALTSACNEECDVATRCALCSPEQSLCWASDGLASFSCVDLKQDSEHCGLCGFSCGEGIACVNGQCACLDDTTSCLGECADLATSTLNCGACGEACVNGSCVEGACECPDNTDVCVLETGGQACADLASSREHCGACGDACGDLEACVNGVCACAEALCDGRCVDLASDSEHCGECSNLCPSINLCGYDSQGYQVCTDGLLACVGGSCECPDGMWLCNGECQNSECYCSSAEILCDSWCLNPSFDEEHCGDCDNACAEGELCSLGSCNVLAQIFLTDSAACLMEEGRRVTCWSIPWFETMPYPFEVNEDVDLFATGAFRRCIDSGDQLSCARISTSGLAGALPSVALPADVAEIALGLTHSCLRDGAGAVECWGSSAVGQLGFYDTEGLYGEDSLDRFAIAGLSPAMAIALGDTHSCAIAAGEVWCWGNNDREQLAQEASVESSETPLLVAGLIDVTAIAAGSTQTCAVVAGEVWCWGEAVTEPMTPEVSVGKLEGLSDIVELYMAPGRGCAVDTSAQLWCWGADPVGDGSEGASAVPVSVELPGRVVDVALNAQSGCALTEFGNVWCWSRSIACWSDPVEEVGRAVLAPKRCEL